MPEILAPVVIRTAAGNFPLVVSPAGLKAALGDSRSDRSIRSDCENGVIPTLPRLGGPGAHHRIPLARYFDQLGVPYEIVRAEAQ